MDVGNVLLNAKSFSVLHLIDFTYNKRGINQKQESMGKCKNCEVQLLTLDCLVFVHYKSVLQVISLRKMTANVILAMDWSISNS